MDSKRNEWEAGRRRASLSPPSKTDAWTGSVLGMHLTRRWPFLCSGWAHYDTNAESRGGVSGPGKYGKRIGPGGNASAKHGEQQQGVVWRSVVRRRNKWKDTTRAQKAVPRVKRQTGECPLRFEASPQLRRHKRWQVGRRLARRHGQDTGRRKREERLQAEICVLV